jgi:hypothetical protein
MIANLLFASPQRWFRVKVWTTATMGVLVLLTMARCAGGGGALATPPLPTGTSTALHAPVTAPITVSAAPTYGPADPIALEAVNAFLAHDLEKFTALAVPEAAVLAAEAPVPAPNGVITGNVEVVHAGPTLQDLKVPTSFGVMNITMGVHDGAWLVEDMAYEQ